MREAERRWRLWSHGQARVIFALWFALCWYNQLRKMLRHIPPFVAFCDYISAYAIRGSAQVCVVTLRSCAAGSILRSFFSRFINLPTLTLNWIWRFSVIAMQHLFDASGFFLFFGNVTAPLLHYGLFQVQPAEVNAAFNFDHSPSSRYRTNGKQSRTSIAPLCSKLTAGRLFQPVAPYRVQCRHGNLGERH